MAGENENVIIGAEFEGEGIARGVDALIAKLKEAKEMEALLKQEVKDFTQALKDNEKEIQRLQKQMDGMSLSSQKAVRDHKELGRTIDQLRDKSKTLNNGLAEARRDLTTQSAAIKNYNSALNDAKRSNEQTEKAVQKLTSINGYAAGAVNNLRGQVLNLVTSLISGFAGGILSSVLPAITEWTLAMIGANDELTEFQKQQALTTEMQQKANEQFASGFAKMELFRGKLTDVTIPEKQRLDILKDYNKLADEANQIDAKQINNLDLINSAIDRQINLLRARAIARGVESVVGEKAEALFLAQLNAENRERVRVNSQGAFFQGSTAPEIKPMRAGERIQVYNTITKRMETRVLTEADVKQMDAEAKRVREEWRKTQEDNRVRQRVDTDKDVLAAQEDLDRALKVGLNLLPSDGLTTQAGQRTPRPRRTREIENVYERELAQLRARLAAVTEKSFESEGLIREKFETQLDKEYQKIADYLKGKQLTNEQAESLRGILKQINDVELSNSLEEFRRKRVEALRKIDDAIFAVQLEGAQRRVENIRDEFQRESQAIAQGYEQQAATIRRQQAEFTRTLEAEVTKGLVSPVVAQQRRLIATILFGGLLDEAERAKINRELELSFKMFQDTIRQAQERFGEDLVSNDETTTALLQAETNRYFAGKVSYEKYQENITRITREGAKARQIIRLNELQDELKLVNERLATTTDPKQKRQLEEQQRNLRSQLASLRNEINKGAASEMEGEEKRRIGALIKYAEAVNSLLQTIGNFWQQVNEVEERSLERSIALQERRVANAKEVAERGNAEYLEQEQKRLDELERKREDNARKQLAINNALTLSQATVAAVTAIAQAVQTGSPFAAIAAVGAVIGAIAAAYSFVSSLQPVNPSFYEGTEYVQGSGRRLGRDTVPANLHIGERVIRDQDNKQYWDTLHAIHNHTVPPHVLNNFVNAYPNVYLPAVDYSRLGRATDTQSQISTEKVTKELQGINAKMEALTEIMASMKMNVSMDEQGFAASISRHLKQQKLRKRS